MIRSTIAEWADECIVFLIFSCIYFFISLNIMMICALLASIKKDTEREKNNTGTTDDSYIHLILLYTICMQKLWSKCLFCVVVCFFFLKFDVNQANCDWYQRDMFIFIKIYAIFKFTRKRISSNDKVFYRSNSSICVINIFGSN